MESNKVDAGLNWLDRGLSMVEKYKLKTIFKAFFIILLVSVLVGFISNPTFVFEQYKKWEDKQHTELIEKRLANNEKIHLTCERLMYKVGADRVMLLELHNGGSNIAGLPFLKASCIYEAMNEGVYPIADQYQQQQLSLIPFSSYLAQHTHWCGEVEDLESIDKTLHYRMMANGTKHFAAKCIHGVNTPVAFIFVSFSNVPEGHDCERVREEIRHAALEIALLLELNK